MTLCPGRPAEQTQLPVSGPYPQRDSDLAQVSSHGRSLDVGESLGLARLVGVADDGQR